MTIAQEVENRTQAVIRRHKQGLRLARNAVYRSFDGNELVELRAVHFWEDDNAVIRFYFNDTTVTVRPEWTKALDDDVIIGVERWDCVKPNGIHETVSLDEIRDMVLNTFACQEARKREREIMPIEGDKQQ